MTRPIATKGKIPIVIKLIANKISNILLSINNP